MATQQTIWERFDDLIAKAATPEAAAHLTAQKLQAEIMHSKLGGIEHALGQLLRQLAAQK